MSDIVKRLNTPPVANHYYSPGQTLEGPVLTERREAADEIERLREENERLRAENARLLSALKSKVRSKTLILEGHKSWMDKK